MSVIQHESFENDWEENWSSEEQSPSSMSFVEYDGDEPERGGGDYYLHTRVVAANPYAYALTESAPTTSAFYFRTWVRLVDHALEDTESAAAFAGIYSAASSLVCKFYPYNASGTIVLLFAFWDASAQRGHVLGAMAADTWYRLEAHIDGINNTWECRVNGVMSSAGTIGSATRAGNRMFCGIYDADNDLCVDLDSMEWRDEYWPGVGIPAVSATDVVNMVETPVKDGTKTVLDSLDAGEVGVNKPTKKLSDRMLVTNVGNLVTNGTFELGFQGGDPNIPVGWTSSGLDAGEASDETSDVHSGNHAVKLDTTSMVPVGEGLQSNDFTLVAGRTYKLTMYIKKSNLYQLTAYICRGSPLQMEWTETLGNGYSDWTEYSKEFIASTTASNCYLWIGRAGDGTLVALVDDVTLVEKDSTLRMDVTKRASEAAVLGDAVSKEGTKRITETTNLAEIVVKEGTKTTLDVVYAGEAYTPTRRVTRSLSDAIQVVESGTLTFWKTVSGGVWQPMKYVVDLFVGYLNNDWTVRSAVTSVWNTVSDKITSWTENS